MSWLRKVLSREPGPKIRGPLGAVTDAALKEAGAHAGPGEGEQVAETDRRHSAFFVATFSLLAKMAQADGVVSLDEIETVDRFVRDELDCPAAVRRFGVCVFNEAKHSSYSFKEFAVQFRRLFGDDSHLRLLMLELLHRLAMADGVLHEREAELLNTAARVFKISKSDADYIMAEFQPGPQQPYAVLRCEPGAPAAEIEEHYRRLLAEYDVDDEVAHGMPREFHRLTEKKRAEIEAAYRALTEPPSK